MIPSEAQARVLVDECVRGGVTDAVACPGSRNAPLLMALHAADRGGRLRLHVRVDERSAGFLAVGLAARSGRVVPVVVTSGTAVANLHPAVLEASHDGVGLLVVSADRPLELVGSGANQTVDQVGLFGAAVRGSWVLPLAERRPGAVARWRSTVVRALHDAGGVDPGPVQLDVPLREPLVPDRPDEPDPDGWCEPLDGRPDGRPWTRTPTPTVSRPELPLTPGLRTLVVAGHRGDAAVLPAGVPVLAEPSSPLWTDPRGGHLLRAGSWVLAGGHDALRPEQVVVLGRPTLHRSVSRLLADPRVTVLADPGAARDWTDVAGTVRAVGALPPPRDWAPDPAFADAWRAADAAAAHRVREHVTGGPALAAAVVDALPPGALLVVGSSNPVRDVALTATPRGDVRVTSARGVSGIDGAVSLATGAALAHDGPTYALLGDLTVLHDTNGLLVGPTEPRPDLTIVVVNDDGGGIFTQLEQGAPAHADAFERMFATPHGTDLAALCRAHGVPHRRVTDLAELADALRPGPGVRMVEVPVDRSRRRDEARATADAVAEIVTESLARISARRAETATTPS